MLDVEEDILFQKHFKDKYEPLRHGESRYGMEVMGLLYYEPVSNHCLCLLADILAECINHNAIQSKKKGLQRIGKKSDKRFARLRNTGYITIVDGFVLPNISKEHLRRCYYEDKIKEERKEEG